MSDIAFIKFLRAQIENENSDVRNESAKIILKFKTNASRACDDIFEQLAGEAEKQGADSCKRQLTRNSLDMISSTQNAIFYNILNTKIAPNVTPHGGKSPKFIADQVFCTIANVMERKLKRESDSTNSLLSSTQLP